MWPKPIKEDEVRRKKVELALNQLSEIKEQVELMNYLGGTVDYIDRKVMAIEKYLNIEFEEKPAQMASLTAVKKK